jgi:DNA-binding SARP family transcriptional activator/TolB-like protein/Tfp pilus assembly protein PilF
VDAIVTSSLAVLGSFAIRVGGCDIGALPRKAQAFIAYLAMQPGRQVPREIVADLLWTHSGPEQARHSVRQMLMVLRRTPFGDLLRSSADALWIEPGAITVDAMTMEAGLAASDAEELSHCVALYRGALLEGFPAVSPGFDDWLRLERARLGTVMARLLRRLIATEIAVGACDAAVESATRLVGLDTLDEAAHRSLMDCYARAGRRAEALQQFDLCADILRDELDIAPDAETAALADSIRAGAWPPRSESAAVGFDAPSNAPPTADVVPIEKNPSRWRRFRYAIFGAAAALGVVAVSAVVFALRQPATLPPGVIVSSFRNDSGVPAQTDAIAGFGDLVKFDLATRQHLRLTDDLPADAGLAEPARDRARQAGGGRYELDGSAIFSGIALHVTARLADIRDHTELWSAQYDTPAEDARRTVEDIASHVARAVARDGDLTVEAPPSPWIDAPRAARELLALGHQIDYSTAGTSAATEPIYRLAARLDQDNADVLAHLANAYIRANVPPGPMDPVALEDADRMLAHALRLDPTNVFALYNNCVLRATQGQIAESVELCKRTLDIDPRYPGGLRQLGVDYLMLGDAAQAIVSFQESIDASPHLRLVFRALKGLGVAALVQGRRDDAIAYFRRSMDADAEGLDDEQLWLAAALEMNGDHAGAARQLTLFLDRRTGLRVDANYLRLLRAPAFADCREQVLAALAGAGYRRQGDARQ